MAYRVEDGNGIYLGEPRTLGTPGPKPRFPLVDMYIGQFIRVPRDEEQKLLRAIRNIKAKRGMVFDMRQEGIGGSWIALRVR